MDFHASKRQNFFEAGQVQLLGQLAEQLPQSDLSKLPSLDSLVGHHGFQSNHCCTHPCFTSPLKVKGKMHSDPSSVRQPES
jgi:hypothetical protein